MAGREVFIVKERKRKGRERKREEKREYREF